MTNVFHGAAHTFPSGHGDFRSPDTDPAPLRNAGSPVWTTTMSYRLTPSAERSEYASTSCASASER